MITLLHNKVLSAVYGIQQGLNRDNYFNFSKLLDVNATLKQSEDLESKIKLCGLDELSAEEKKQIIQILNAELIAYDDHDFNDFVYGYSKKDIQEVNDYLKTTWGVQSEGNSVL